MATLRPRPAGAPRIHTPRSSAETYLVGRDLPASGTRPVLDLSGFLTRLGLERAWRTRIATTAALAVDNACSHAYPGTDGPLEVHVELEDQTLTLTVVDHGVGYDPTAVATSPQDAPTGLDLIHALAERVDVTSGPEGTRLVLTFELAPVRFEEETPALDELDHLDPRACRELLALAKGGDLDLPAFLMPTVGRLLSAPARSADPTACLFA